MTTSFEQQTGTCPVCGGQMVATVKVLHSWEGDVLRKIPESVQCVTGCESQVGDNRSRMLAVFG